MEHDALLTMIRIACENWRRDYNDHTRKELLKGIWETCDAMIQDLRGREDHDHYEHPIRELKIMQDYAESALKGEMEMGKVFGLILNDIHRVTGLPREHQ